MFNSPTYEEYLKQIEENPTKYVGKMLCPNCWGFQQYNGTKRILVEDEQIDVNNHVSKYMRLKKFVVKNIIGIKLKKPVEIKCDCETCAHFSE